MPEHRTIASLMNAKRRSGFASVAADDRFSQIYWPERRKARKPQYLQLQTFPVVLLSESCCSNPTHAEAIQQHPLINVEWSLQPPGFGLLWRYKVFSGIVFTHQSEAQSTAHVRFLGITLHRMVCGSLCREWCRRRPCNSVIFRLWGRLLKMGKNQVLWDTGSHMWIF